jgi:hypothetical protein
MTAGRPHIGLSDRTLNDDRLAETDSRIVTGEQARHIEERLLT